MSEPPHPNPDPKPGTDEPGKSALPIVIVSVLALVALCAFQMAC
jgi:hypothetical protein